MLYAIVFLSAGFAILSIELIRLRRKVTKMSRYLNYLHKSRKRAIGGQSVAQRARDSISFTV
jgi:hypothetical protein